MDQMPTQTTTPAGRARARALAIPLQGTPGPANAITDVAGVLVGYSTIIKGEALVGITYIKYIKQYKGPVDYIPMDQYLTDPNYLSLSAKAMHPNAAKLYIDFACSAEGQKEIAEDGEFVLAPGVYPPIKDADKVAPKMVFMDNPSEEEFKKLMSGTFRDIFFAK